ncbi:phosphopantetheine-binding protein [Dyella tabacisoli]|uniref:Acyl carrier protein n=1 Tax=Dyella tabacisoli TaxID=2282381 RepID=A0A369UV81_9GAMM|nr:phosphopantetheine-binding protein [Dyella tabacisoli]RDD82259.1 acyl carrier protein [Dyella tabacisoli]
MAEQTAAQHELAILMVSALKLETVRPEQIDVDMPLFGSELGLDSIDALEIALAITKRYGFQLRSDHADNRQIFSSLRALSEYIELHRTT